ncbi:MAG: hypothetical protein GY749_10505 [Desulfobacteraceae bacterium]|nr:hypothetical protein [Desulfobacteraceae bacterium]
MSVAVVVKKDGKIVIASDSRASFGDTVVPTDNHKARSGKLVIHTLPRQGGQFMRTYLMTSLKANRFRHY